MIQKYTMKQVAGCVVQVKSDRGIYYLVADADPILAALTKFKKAVEKDRCSECPFLNDAEGMHQQIAALTLRAESLDRIITEGTEREVALTAANAKQAEEIGRLREALEIIIDPMTDYLPFIKATARAALNGEKETDHESV